MKWLVDLVIAAIGIPPCYVSRADFGGHDFDGVELDADGNWHTLDLSAIVPTNAKCVHVHTKMVSDTVNGKVRFRVSGYSGAQFRCTLRTIVANVTVGAFIPIGLSNDRKIDYQYSMATFGARSLTVRGWWF